MFAQQTHIVCPKCGMVSHNPNDIQNRYCGNCHGFHDDLIQGLVISRFAEVARPIMRRFMAANSCIAAARTTIEVLARYRIPAIAKPVKYCFMVPARGYQRIAGLSDEERAEVRAKCKNWRQEKDEEGSWDGHLIVAAAGRWIIDCTIDQMGSEEFGVTMPQEVFVVDTIGREWSPEGNVDIRLGLVLDSGDAASLQYTSIPNEGYLETDAWNDHGLPLLAAQIAAKMGVRQ